MIDHTDAVAMPDLSQLISERKSAHGWTYRDLEVRSSGVMTYQRWQQLAKGTRVREFPEPATLRAIADAIEVDVTTVIIATARTIGLPVRAVGTDFSAMLPAGVDGIGPELRDAILGVIRVASRHAAAEPAAGGAPHPEDQAAIAASREAHRRTRPPAGGGAA